MLVSAPDSPISAEARAACAAWFGPCVLEVAPLPVAGFSGVTLARVRPRGTAAWFVLKSFAPGTLRERAGWVHGLARHLAAAGVDEVRPPARTPTGATLVGDAGGRLWELVPFVDGVPVAAPTPAQATAALEALARLHVAAATVPDAPPRAGPAPGVARRVARARELLDRPWHERVAGHASAGADACAAAVSDRMHRAIAIVAAAGGPHALEAVAAARFPAVPLQAVLRDVWAEHVLFTPACGDAVRPSRVAGIVDLHAAGIDSPAVDIARLVGSWRIPQAGASADLAAAWPDAIAAYEAVRPLAEPERAAIAFLHAAGVVCGLDNWFRWTLEEGRSFPVAAAVIDRIDWLLADLPAALDWLAARTPNRV